MARMMGANFKLVGRCHPWCGNRELGVGRAAENAAWRRELDADERWADVEYDVFRRLADERARDHEIYEAFLRGD